MIPCQPERTPAPQRRRARPLALWCILLLWVGSAGAAHGSSLIYKNYLVRYDRGWDILCEPYVVQPGDWVLKIFRQKGEIAHKDFRDFLGIFERLNPNVRDIDMIRPGQTIDIPLRKLAHGTLPGQASGMVTIPFVTLARVMDVLHQHAQEYQVRWGDTVSQLVAAHYGRYGTRSYQEGIKLFQAANPQVTDIDRIYAGQRVYLPEPSIREEAWYAAMYDEQGNLKETIDRGPGAPGIPVTAGAELQAPAAAEAAEPESPLAQAAATVGGELLDKGTYFIPRAGEPDFEIDLSRNPLLDLQTNKLLFSQDGRVMDRDSAEVETLWPRTRVVRYDARASVPELVGAIFEALDQPDTHAEEVGFDDQGVRVAVRAKWIKTQSDQRKLCITPIAGPHEQTPESMRRYLDQHGIVLKEMLPGGRATATGTGSRAERHAIKDILAIAPTGQKDFVQNLARALQFTYSPNVAVTFPYAGIQIKAYADLVSAPGGREVLLDFGELYGDAIKALRQSGLDVVQIAPDEPYTAVAAKVLAGLGEQFVEHPSFPAAPRPPPYNATVTIYGLLYTNAENNKHTLLSAAALHPAITDLLSADGIAVVTW
jgi:hypothetical protein